MLFSDLVVKPYCHFFQLSPVAFIMYVVDMCLQRSSCPLRNGVLFSSSFFFLIFYTYIFISVARIHVPDMGFPVYLFQPLLHRISIKIVPIELRHETVRWNAVCNANIRPTSTSSKPMPLFFLTITVIVSYAVRRPVTLLSLRIFCHVFLQLFSFIYDP